MLASETNHPKTLTKPFKILLIEDNLDHAHIIEEMLNEINLIRHEFMHEKCLSAGLDALDNRDFDLIL